MRDAHGSRRLAVGLRTILSRWEIWARSQRLARRLRHQTPLARGLGRPGGDRLGIAAGGLWTGGIPRRHGEVELIEIPRALQRLRDMALAMERGEDWWCVLGRCVARAAAVGVLWDKAVLMFGRRRS